MDDLFKKRIAQILYTLIMFLMTLNVHQSAFAAKCYYPHDSNPTTVIKAYPDRIFSDSHPNAAQVAKWKDTEIFVKSGTKFQIYGKVYPWGKSASGGKEKRCEMIKCSTVKKNYKEFLSYAGVCKRGGDEMQNEGEFLKPVRENQGCYFEDGMGLYGLIIPGGSKDINYDVNSGYDPYTDNAASFHFYTLDKDADQGVKKENGTSHIFTLKNAYTYSADTGKYTRIDNPSGRLYVKFMDNFYADNRGEYRLLFKEVEKEGFIKRVFEIFEERLSMVSEGLLSSVASSVRDFAMVVIYVYIVITLFSFLIGSVSMTQGEIVVRLFKIGLILSLISNQGLFFIDKMLKDLLESVPRQIASSVLKAGGLSGNVSMSSGNSMSGVSSAISGYQGFFDLCINMSTHIKIIALLFTSKIYFIFLLYILLIMYLTLIFKVILMGILCLFRLALLLVLYPIFLLLLLFKTTAESFNSWLNQFISAGVLSIMIATILVLTNEFLGEGLERLLAYTVCQDTFIGIPYFYVSDKNELAEVLTLRNYLFIFLKSIIIIKVSDNLPKMADGFSGTIIGGLSSMYGHGIRSGSGLLSAGKDMFSDGLDVALKTLHLDKPLDKANSAIRRVNPLYHISDKIYAAHKGLDAVKDAYKNSLGAFMNPNHNDPFGIKEFFADIDKKNSDVSLEERAQKYADSKMADKYSVSKKAYATDDDIDAFVNEHQGNDANSERHRRVAESLKYDNREYKILSEIEKYKDLGVDKVVEDLSNNIAVTDDDIAKNAMRDVKEKLMKGDKLEDMMKESREKLMDKNNMVQHWKKRDMNAN